MRLTFAGLAILFFANWAQAQGGETPAATCTLEFKIDGAIGPASLDLLERAEKRALQNNCASILMVLNTPGGSLQTTRLMVEKILASKVPYLCLVAPAGGHAGSAGAILLQACHFSGAFNTTNIGAATPVSGGGEQIGEDMRKKLVNDTKSWVVGLAELRGRNVKFAQEIVEDAKAVSAREALEIKAIEWTGDVKESFVSAANGRKTTIENKDATISTGALVEFAQDLRYRIMDFLTNPQFAYLLFMGSLGLLYFELTHPGTIAPGVIGAIGLAISLVSLHMLNVTWGGVLLIVLGLMLMIAEAFVASFGILGIGGVIAFFIGSLFLFDVDVQGFELPLLTILPVTLFLGALMVGIAYLAYSTRKRVHHDQSGKEYLMGKTGFVTSIEGNGDHGYAEIEGEVWKFQSVAAVTVGDKVRVSQIQGLTLSVTRV
jgi:membrane-bound serine protease (ClpP class)